jgi:hypothetical protein
MGEPALRAVSGGADWPYTFREVELASLYVDATYQRPLTTFVKRIVEDFDPRLLIPLVVSKRKNRRQMAVVDGQTRMTALRQMGRTHAPCLVFDGTAEEEAMLFARFQSERKGIRPFHRHRAALKAGDEIAKKVAAETKKHGYLLVDAGATVYPSTITAVRAVEDLARADLLDHVLGVTARAWSLQHEASAYGKGHPLNNEVLRGLAYFIERDEPDDSRLVRVLAKTDPQELTLRASHLRQGRGHGGKSPSYMAEAIRADYSKRGA